MEQSRATVHPAIAAELALLDPAVRADAVAASRLVDPDFLEIGQSGRLWSRDSILAEFGTAGSLPRVQVSELDARDLAPGLALVTYVSSLEGRSIRRSSIWRETDDGWRALFHQGTRID